MKSFYIVATIDGLFETVWIFKGESLYFFFWNYWSIKRYARIELKSSTILVCKSYTVIIFSNLFENCWKNQVFSKQCEFFFNDFELFEILRTLIFFYQIYKILSKSIRGQNCAFFSRFLIKWDILIVKSYSSFMTRLHSTAKEALYMAQPCKLVFCLNYPLPDQSERNSNSTKEKEKNFII